MLLRDFDGRSSLLQDYLLPSGALVRQVVSGRDELTGHELALSEELSLAQHGHHAAN
jgi:hypothetical protein